MKRSVPIWVCALLLAACRQISQTVEDTFQPRDTIIPRRPPPATEVTQVSSDTITTVSTSIHITTDWPLVDAKDSMLLVKALKIYEQQAARTRGSDTATITITINGQQLRLPAHAGQTGAGVNVRLNTGSGAAEAGRE